MSKPINLNKVAEQLELPEFEYNKNVYQIRKLSRDEAEKINSEESLEDQLREAEDFDGVVSAVASAIDVLVEPVVKTGPKSKKLGEVLAAEFKKGVITFETVIAVRYAITGARENALRPT
jgi:hypothetical protein